jgi:hypothetical protein
MGLKKSDIRAVLKNENATDEEKIGEILDLLHVETDQLKAELDDAKDSAKNKAGEWETKAKEWETKYNSEHTAFEDYKANETREQETKAKENAYKELLTSAGVSNKLVDLVVKASAKEIEALTLKDGKIEGADKLTKSIKENYKDYITTTEQRGADIQNPPDNGGGSAFEKMPLSEKMEYANTHPDAPDVKAWLGK